MENSSHIVPVKKHKCLAENQRKQRFLKQYEKRYCYLRETLDVIRLSSKTFDEWMKEDKEFSDQVERLRAVPVGVRFGLTPKS